MGRRIIYQVHLPPSTTQAAAAPSSTFISSSRLAGGGAGKVEGEVVELKAQVSLQAKVQRHPRVTSALLI